MAKHAPDTTIDAMLDEIATATRIDIVSDSSTPTTLANSIAFTTLSGGDFTNADDTSGRKVTVSAKSAVDIGTTGDANHVVLSQGTVSTFKYILTGDGQTLTQGGTVDIPSFKINVEDPV